MNGRTSFEPMLEVYNLFNRANFTAYQLNESSATFGQPTAATGLGYAPRVPLDAGLSKTVAWHREHASPALSKRPEVSH